MKTTERIAFAALLAAALGVVPVARAVAATPVAGAVDVHRNVVWRTVDGEQLTLDAYVPHGDGDAARPAVILVHGGGGRAGDKHSLAEQGFVAFSVDYRLAPKHPYPAAVDDVQAAVRWARDPAQVKAYGIDPARIGALGGSAGGHLVGMLATLGEGPLDRGARIAAAVSWSGPMSFNGRAPTEAQPGRGLESVKLFLGCETPTDCPQAVEASPVTHIDPTDAPMFLANSSNELVSATQAASMAAALDHAGVQNQLMIVPGSAHASKMAPKIWDQTLAFLRSHLGVASGPSPSPSTSKSGSAAGHADGGGGIVLMAAGLAGVVVGAGFTTVVVRRRRAASD